MSEIYRVGLYLRLSREDDDKNTLSESITNQKRLLLQYVKENNLSVYDIYIDDGFSGTNFNRPSFVRLLRDIELGKVNMVITKDMSRLGRDYIGTGNLIEKYFPEHNVRYIALTDNIDTFLDSVNNDIAPFKAIMNDMYAKDISKKIKSSLKAKMKEGKWVGGRAPFGYTKDPNDKNHLVIDSEKALVVRKIFALCLAGKSFYKIAKQLTDENIKPPAWYYDFAWKNNHLKYRKWQAKTIKDILTNQIYIGDMVQHRRSKVNYKVKKVIKNKESDYIIVKNTHEAIISKEIFWEAQKKIPQNKGRSDQKERHLLDGLLYCGDCKHHLSITPRRKKDNQCYTICNYYRTYLEQKLCTTHSNNYDKLEKELITSLTKLCLPYLNKDKIKNRVLTNIYRDNKINYKKELAKIKLDIKQINNNLDSIYLDKLKNNITNDQYRRLKEKLELELERKQKRYQTLNDINNDSKEKVIYEYIDLFCQMHNPSRELIISLIDRIEITASKKVNINVTFKV